MPARKGRVASALRHALKRHQRALGDGPLVLAVSGGTDSLALLLASATVPHRREMVVAHFSHGLRRSADPREARLVKRVAASLGFAFEHGSAQVGRTEEQARDARYAFLAAVARAHRAGAVVTAHTEDDQAETLLLRLTRGSGLRGAGAIRELSTRTVGGSPLTLLRPLLAVGRADTAAVCAEAGIKPVSDGSNRSLRFARNRVRGRVMPELLRINPDARGALARFAQSAQADEALLRSWAADAVREIESRKASRVTWHRHALAEVAEPLLVRALQSAWEHLAGDGAALSVAKVRASLELLRGSHGGELSLGRGIRLVVEQETCRLTAAPQPDPAGWGPQALAVPGTTRAGDWTATVSLMEQAAREPLAQTVSTEATGKGWRTLIDAEAVGEKLCIRRRTRGDRFQPLGMTEPVRLQNVLVNAKVPRTERDALPLVVSDRGIAWVPGVRVADWAHVTRSTRRVIAVSLEPSQARGH